MASHRVVLLSLFITVAPAAANYQVKFYEHKNLQGRGIAVSIDNAGLEDCRDFSGDFAYLTDAVSSISWGSNVAVTVYDQYNCGGNQLLLQKGRKYKFYDKVLFEEKGWEDTLKSRRVDNLRFVCKTEQCKYKNINMPRLKCVCEAKWNDDIRSYRIHAYDDDDDE